MLGFGCALDLDPDSSILRTIRLASPARAIPHLSIIAGLDQFASAPIAHALPSGEVIVLARVGHNAILFDPEAIAAVERRVLSVHAAAR